MLSEPNRRRKRSGVEVYKLINMENGLDIQIENNVRKYDFKPRVSHGGVDENKAFLAMLDEYVGKTRYQLPESVRGIDVGCRGMQYADGLVTFLEKYGKKDRQVRPVHLVGVEGAEDFLGFEWGSLKNAIEEDRLNPTKLDLVYQWLENEQDMNYIVNKTDINEFNTATIFAPGPDTRLSMVSVLAYMSRDPEDRKISRYMIDGEYITNSIEQALKPRMTEGGLLVVSTIYDGAPTKKVLASLERAGFDVLLSEENKFSGRFWNWPNHYDHMIVARNKP